MPVGNGDYVLELASKDNFVIGGKHTFSGANFYLQPYLNFAPSQRFRFTDASGNAVDVCNHSYKETRTDKTTPRLIQFHTLKNAVNPPFLGGVSIFGTVAA